MAISLAAIPNPASIPEFERSAIRRDDWLSTRLTPLADSADAALIRASRAIWAGTQPVRVVTTPYVTISAQSQRWHMFSGPMKVDEFVRLRYYVAGEGPNRPQTPAWMASEVVVPAHPSEWWRGLDSFRSSFRDKLLLGAVTAFRIHLDEVQTDGNVPRDLDAVAAYFSRQFANHLNHGEHIVRTEVWYGRAPIAPPGASNPEQLLLPRPGEILEERLSLPPYRNLLSRDREGDVTWMLLYFQS